MTSRATSHEHSAPRLPSRAPDEVEAAFVAANANPKPQVDLLEDTPGGRPPGYENPVVFEVPELLPLRAVNIAWTAARFAIVLWTASIALVAVRTTRRIDGVESDESIAAAGDDMAVVVLVGVVLIAALFGASLWWSRTVAENTRRLRGRWPSLNRATRVWFYPTVWVALAALTFLRVEVTAEFDPLPAITAIVFALTLYCPYSMLHRIFKTLTRIRPDGAIRASYLLDLAGFGIIWWRLTDWPEPITAADAGTVDAMAWAAIASSGLLLISAGITANLCHQVILAQRYRIRVLATRHIQGLALPLVPRRAWGRVRTNIDDAATRGAGPVGDIVRATDLVVGPGGAPSAAVVAARRTVVPGRVSEAAAPTTTTTGERPPPRPRVAGGTEQPSRRAVARDGDPPATPRRRPVPGAAGQVTPRRRPPLAGAGTGAGGEVAGRPRPGASPAGAASNRAAAAAARRSAMTGSAAARRSAASGAAAGRRAGLPGAAAARRTVAPGAAGAAVARRRAAASVTADTAARRTFAAEAGARRRAASGRDAESTAESTAGSGVGAPPPPLAHAGSGPDRPPRSPGVGPQPKRDVHSGVHHVDTDEPPEPTTLVGVLRFLSLGAHLVLAATFVWFVVEARRASPSATGGLQPSHIDRLDLVRTANVVAFAATVLLLGAWGYAASTVARGCERATPPPWLVLATCVPATVLTLAGLVVDRRVGEGIVFTLAVLAAGAGGACSLALMSTMSRDVDGASHGLQIWAAVMAVVGLGLTIGGYLQPIEPADSVDILTLIAVLTSILVGLAVLLGAPASGELDDVVDERPLASSEQSSGL